MFKASVLNYPHPFEDPDSTILELSAKMLTRIEALEANLEDHLGITRSAGEEVNVEHLVENICEFYQGLAEQFYWVSRKIRQCVEFTGRKRCYGEGEIVERVHGKAMESVGRKLEVYDQIKGIERVLAARDPYLTLEKEKEVNTDERESPSPSVFSFMPHGRK